MSWRKKRRGPECGYYYRSRSVDGRSVKQYVGGGIVGRTADHLDQLERRDRAAARAAFEAEETERERASGPLIGLCRLGDQLAVATLLLAGYYRHHEGEWRRRGRPKRG